MESVSFGGVWRRHPMTPIELRSRRNTVQQLGDSISRHALASGFSRLIAQEPWAKAQRLMKIERYCGLDDAAI